MGGLIMDFYYNPNQPIYRFQFGICDDRNHLSVYSQNVDDIVLFMNQHGFRNNEMYRYIQQINCTINEYKNISSDMLQIIKLRSNSNTELYSVMTSQYIFERCVENCGSALTHALWLSSLLVEYKENPLMEMISSLAEKLPYTVIQDFSRCIDESVPIDSYQSNNNEIIDKLISDNVPIDPESTQTITIESYVSGFNSLL